jgi:hypothetical protein
MEAAPASGDLEFLTLVRGGKRKTRIPLYRRGDAAPVFEMHCEFVLIDLRIHNTVPTDAVVNVKRFTEPIMGV